jgi:hypothetical protein
MTSKHLGSDRQISRVWVAKIHPGAGIEAIRSFGRGRRVFLEERCRVAIVEAEAGAVSVSTMVDAQVTRKRCEENWLAKGDQDIAKIL